METDEKRKPARETYDAIVDITPSKGIATRAYVLVKFTFSIDDESLRLDAPEALRHDFRNEGLEPRLRPGSDFWMAKQATDFVIQGSAFPPGGRPVERMTVSAQIGSTTKKIVVFGRRIVQWDSAGRPRIMPTDLFDEIPLTYENAYGGIDWRVPIGEDDPNTISAELRVDHPGLYPRNPFGKGYLVGPEQPAEPVEMPNLEDPDDLLSPERLVTADPKLWYLQPLPWCYEWVQALTFPRYIFFMSEIDAWFPGPEDNGMPEVKRGFLIPNYRSVMAAHSLENGIHPCFFQEASYGLILPNLKENTPVVLESMHPYRHQICFNLPAAAPRIEIGVDGDCEPVRPLLHSIVCRPAEMRLTMIYSGHRELPRKFIPGIHKEIPVSAHINGDVPINFQAPRTVKDQIDEAMKKGGSK
jgi:hypothetical protein